MASTRGTRRFRGLRRLIVAGGAWLLLAGPLGGCASYSYERLTLGATREQYEAVFAEDALRRTERTLCVVEQPRPGQTDAIVALLTPDRRIAAKFYARSGTRVRGWRGAELRYELVGELDPRLAGYERVGPIDTLRAIAADLSAQTTDPLAKEAHGWIAAGLVRAVQRWPHVEDEGPAVTRVQDYLDRVPIGGLAQLSSMPDGVFRMSYSAGEPR